MRNNNIRVGSKVMDMSTREVGRVGKIEEFYDMNLDVHSTNIYMVLEDGRIEIIKPENASIYIDFEDKYKFKDGDYVEIVSSDKFNSSMGRILRKFYSREPNSPIMYYVELIQYNSFLFVGSDYIVLEEKNLKFKRTREVTLNAGEFVKRFHNGDILTGALIKTKNEDLGINFGDLRIVLDERNNRKLIQIEKNEVVELNHDFLSSEFILIEESINWSYK